MKYSVKDVKITLNGVELKPHIIEDVSVEVNRRIASPHIPPQGVMCDVILARISNRHDECSVELRVEKMLPPIADRAILPWTAVVDVCRTILTKDISPNASITEILHPEAPFHSEVPAIQMRDIIVYAHNLFNETVSAFKYPLNECGINRSLSDIEYGEKVKYHYGMYPYD